MSAAAPAKFTFDLDLGHREEKNRLLTESGLTAMLADARNAGFAEGFAAGEQGVNAKTAKQLATAASEMGDRVAALAASLDDMKKTTLTEAVDLAASIARKLATSLVSAEPTVEIEALINDCLSGLDGVPHLVIRCNTELADAVREIATARIQTSGFTGRLVVMGDPEIPSGDCRLEWVDGGLLRDQAGISEAIDRRIAAYLAARANKHGAPPSIEENE